MWAAISQIKGYKSVKLDKQVGIFFHFYENESIYTPLFIPHLQVGILLYVFINWPKLIEIYYMKLRACLVANEKSRATLDIPRTMIPHSGFVCLGIQINIDVY